MKRELIHIKEAAKLLGVTRQAVYKKLQALGKKPQKVGNKAFIDSETLTEIKEGKKVQPAVAEGVTIATKQGDNGDIELIKILKNQINSLQQDKVTAQRQCDNLQKQIEIKDRQIEDLSVSSREIRILLGNAQKQLGGLLPSQVEQHKPEYGPSQPVDDYFPSDHKQPKMKSKKRKKRKKKKKP